MRAFGSQGTTSLLPTSSNFPAFPSTSSGVVTSAGGAGEPVFSEEVPSGTWAFRKDTLPSISCQGQCQPQMLFICMWVKKNTSRYVFHCVSSACNTRRSTHGMHVCMYQYPLLTYWWSLCCLLAGYCTPLLVYLALHVPC